jgi:hypothetical protein
MGRVEECEITARSIQSVVVSDAWARARDVWFCVFLLLQPPSPFIQPQRSILIDELSAVCQEKYHLLP